MKKLILTALVISGLLIPQICFGEKIQLLKIQPEKKNERKIHPLENFLSANKKRTISPKRSENFEKLLVLLIDFPMEEPDDPQTTGNGKFIQDPAGYNISLGRPPHDYEYFTAHLEALRYYYLAASLEAYELEYDIFPAPERDSSFTAYTLPNEMAYYHPVGASDDLMISRFEEYFTDCFTIADEDENIDFSQYEHFMFIHAGSDWQHDIFGDTPSDIPSFFIQVGDGKEVYVTDGSDSTEVIIDHASNVPEMITQDIEIYTDGSYSEIYNYGVINAVMAHEFGHSLGFVDLYNTRNFSPAVGYWDIMDSGGSSLVGLKVVENGDVSAFFMEGIFPSLPGAWTRILVWEDYFREHDILKDISELNFNEDIEIQPAEKKLDFYSDNLHFIKIPLNEDEYLLLENRQVDPDGDGGAMIKTDLDQRVVLYPTYLGSSDEPNCEYDCLLPGWEWEWQPTEYRSLGGGIVIWHIDEKILYENNNFENNSVNISRSRRAVKIIEADNIDDIGNPYSMYWRGTVYEPFYKYKPVLDENGLFIEWMDYSGSATFNDSISATTHPPLFTNDGNPSFFSIYNISSYDIEPDLERVMSIKFGTQFFDDTKKIAEFDSLFAIGQFGISEDLPTFPVYSDSGVEFFSIVEDSVLNHFGITVQFDLEVTQPILPADYSGNGNDEYLFVSENTLNLLTPENPTNPNIFSSEIVDAPIFIDESDIFIVPTKNNLFINQDSLPIPNAKLAFNGNKIVAASAGNIYLINPSNPDEYDIINFSDYDSDYSPVCYQDNLLPEYNATFIQGKNGEIYKVQDGSAEKIFNLYPYTSEHPTQLAIGDFLDDGQVYLVFGAENRIFAIILDGTLAPGFPVYLEDKIIKPGTFPRIIKFYGEQFLLFEEENQGYLAINSEGKIEPFFSIFWDKSNLNNYFFWDESSEKLYFIYCDNESKLFASYLENISENPLIWNGFRNNKFSLFEGEIDYQPIDDNKLTAFAFPNPSKKGEVRIRVLNAKHNIKLKIFDIAGNIIQKVSVEKSPNDVQDIIWNSSKISSGVYFGIVKSGQEMKKIPIAIEK